jgi:hypothetical protein
VADDPKMVMPLLVGRSDDRCSRISRKSHFRPTKLLEAATGGLGTSKKRGFSSDDSWPAATWLSTDEATINQKH